MNIANGPVRPTPENLHPTLDYCIQMTLPNDREWIGAFFDALYQLTYWFAWQRDEAHTGKDIAATWLRVLSTLKACKPTQPGDGCADGGELLYRQNPDNPCELQSSGDGIHWCTIFDVSLCIPATGQPGGGSEQPPAGGGEVCYHINSPANLQALVPTVVNAGDVVTFSGFGGAANDGVPGRWDCPTGEYFFLGACQAGTEFTDPGDLLPTAPHDSIIAQIDGTWYSCLADITVPGGVSNAQIVLQLNDGTIGDNSGEYAVNVCVTNNQDVVTCETGNFALNTYGFALDSGVGGVPLGLWTPGTGFASADAEVNSSNYQRTARVILDLPGIVLTRVDMHFALTPGTYDNPTFQAVNVLLNGSVNTHIDASAVVSGADQHLVWTGELLVNSIQLIVNASIRGVASYSGALTLKGVEICYKGAVSPFTPPV